jgi:hypothetical protein
MCGWNIMKVIPIKKEETYEWLLHKHYAKRIPSISIAFGLYIENELIGICTFGTPCKLMNDGFCIFNGKLEMQTFELNRLVIKENFNKNCLSYFVSQCLKLIERPSCIVSYADIGQNHIGYIYQATNWLYTGITDQTGGYTYYFDNNWQHPRTTVAKYGTREHKKIMAIKPDIKFKKVSRKHRYFYFIGSKKQKKQMLNLIKYKIMPYPKGDNKRYDDSYTPKVQEILF